MELTLKDSDNKRNYNIIKTCNCRPIKYWGKDGKIVERIYIFPKKEIERVKSLAMVKNPTDAHRNPIAPQYEKYRITDEDELNRANKIWKNIINK